MPLDTTAVALVSGSTLNTKVLFKKSCSAGTSTWFTTSCDNSNGKWKVSEYSTSACTGTATNYEVTLGTGKTALAASLTTATTGFSQSLGSWNLYGCGACTKDVEDKTATYIAAFFGIVCVYLAMVCACMYFFFKTGLIKCE